VNPDSFKIPKALTHYSVIHTQKVQWGEMDALSHLNNVIYYRYAESARIIYLETLVLFDESMSTLLAQSSCQYLRPVFYPDTLMIGVRCRHLGNTSIVVEYSYYSCEQRAIVATGEAVIVRFESTSTTKLSWTDEERKRLMAFEKVVGHTPTNKA
jgi:acyl-CoA thioester hydrolase